MKPIFLFITASTFINICCLAQMTNGKGLNLDHISISIEESDTSIFSVLESKGLNLARNRETYHKGQGTTGNYFFFLNFYLELLYISNEDEANNNIINIGHDNRKRFKWKVNDSSPLAIIFHKKQDSTFIPYQYKKYHQEWMRKHNLFMALSNKELLEPMMITMPPPFAFRTVKNLNELNEFEKRYPTIKKDRIHKEDIKKLTSVIIIVPKKKKEFTDKLKMFNKFSNVKVKTGKDHLLILEFDNQEKGKEIDLQKELGLKIKY